MNLIQRIRQSVLRRPAPITTYPQLLRAAAEVIERDGWIQKTYHQRLASNMAADLTSYDRTRARANEPQGAHCVLGAMICAIAESRGKNGECTEVELIRAFPAFSTSSVSERNDREWQSASDATNWLLDNAEAIELHGGPAILA